MADTMILEKSEGIATITINRPQKHNALDRLTLNRFKSVLHEIRDDEETRVVIITGAGDKAFCTGTDINWLRQWDTREELGFNGQNLFTEIENLPQPVIAAINGYTLGGGCELALACDLRISSDKAVFGLPEVDLGVIPGYGGTQRLSRVVGMGRAKELILVGETIDALKAEKIGLVNKVVEPAGLMSEALVTAKKIAGKGPVALRFAKASVNMSASTDITSGLLFEKMALAVLLSSKDKEEGIAAFFEKRTPNFTGK